MGLNKQSGNMYDFVTHTWNVLKGKCEHDCVYCFMKKWGELPNLRFDEKELQTNLGKNNFIFVGSSTDMFAKNVPPEWITPIINHCFNFDNKYLFQSKNPERFIRFTFPEKTTLGTTVETNRDYKISKAPSVYNRYKAMKYLASEGHRTMITMEPLLDFDLDDMIDLIYFAKPNWVNIGADSKGHGLPEPSWDKVQTLISELKQFTEVKQKKNLERLKR